MTEINKPNHQQLSAFKVDHYQNENVLHAVKLVNWSCMQENNLSTHLKLQIIKDSNIMGNNTRTGLSSTSKPERTTQRTQEISMAHCLQKPNWLYYHLRWPKKESHQKALQQVREQLRKVQFLLSIHQQKSYNNSSIFRKKMN